jgi:exopolysaccharide biosynthesis polyprenyl glycosylphosphotransferase
MSTIRRQILLNAYKLFDVLVMIVAFGAAILPILRENHAVSFAAFLTMRVKIGNFLIFFALLFVWHVLFRHYDLYASRRLSSRSAEIRDILKATSLATLILGAGAVIFRIRMVSPAFLLVFWLLSGLLMVVSRVIMRFVLAQTRLQGRNLRHMLIVGTNSRAIAFARNVESRPDLGYRIIGFTDQEWAGIGNFNSSEYKVVCKLDDLARFVRTSVIDEVLIALPMRSFHDAACRIASLCEEQGILLRVLPNLLDLKRSRHWTEEFEGQTLITHGNGNSEGWPIVVKRILDFVLALAALIILLPLLLLAAALVLLTSPGPVLFAQKRVGLHKREFLVYKFRTMVVGAEEKLKEIEHLNEVSGPVFKIKNDPRITTVGKFLRKTSIDELPQLINVLKGDMSLVGPRPLPIRDYAGFSEDWQRRRFSVRPGITCLWQVSGRNDISFDRWMELDLQYIDKWSLWLDLQILLRTIPAVLKGEGAA